MALTAPRVLYGIHSFSPYSRTDGLFYGIAKVLKSGSIALSAELNELMGGSQKYAWHVEEGGISAELALKFSQYDDFLYTLFLGATPTANAAETGGSVTTLTNKKGTSVKQATTGIASVLTLSGSESDIKFGKFVVKAVSATTVDVYFSSDEDIGRGTNGSYQNDLLKITASPLTITASTPVTVTGFGVKLTGGSGTIGMTTGDTATFSSRPINTASMDVTIGGVADTLFPEFGAILMAQKLGNQEMFEIDAFRCKGAGMPHMFEENAFSEAEVKVKLMYDSALDGIMAIRAIKPV